jgi:hypothetical protein
MTRSEWKCPKCGSRAWGSSNGRRYCQAETTMDLKNPPPSPGACGYSEPLNISPKAVG